MITQSVLVDVNLYLILNFKFAVEMMNLVTSVVWTGRHFKYTAMYYPLQPVSILEKEFALCILSSKPKANRIKWNTLCLLLALDKNTAFYSLLFSSHCRCWTQPLLHSVWKLSQGMVIRHQGCATKILWPSSLHHISQSFFHKPSLFLCYVMAVLLCILSYPER